MYHFLADVIVAIHLAYVLAVVGGLLLIVLGIALRWQWIRNPWFRGVHLAMILVVAFESTINFECPLTTVENRLRAAGGEQPEEGRSFMSRIMETVLHPEWATEETWVMWSYGAAVLILATFLLAPPRFGRRRRLAKSVQVEPAPENKDEPARHPVGR